jgi:hypothetical protein
MRRDEWVTRELDMGHRSNVTRSVNAFRSESSRTIRRLERKLHICTDSAPTQFYCILSQRPSRSPTKRYPDNLVQPYVIRVNGAAA